MKNMKKILALVVAVLMIAASVSALADVALTVNNPVPGHTYSYFQLLVGDLSTDGKLSNVVWGADAVTTAISYGTNKTVTPVAGAEVPEDFLEYLEGLTGSAELTIANTISAMVTGDGHVIGDNTQVPTGYYVIKDAYTDASADQTTTLSTNIVAVVNDTSIAPKAGTTTHKKEVADVNDTTETQLDLSDLTNIDSSKWSTSADYDIGDYIPFKLTTTIASDFAKYTSYYLQVSDTMNGGLVLDPDSISVYVDGNLAEAGDGDGQYVKSVATGNKSFTVTFDKLNAATGAAAGKDVVVYYKARLTADGVVFGNNGNTNESFATFSNNPNGDQTGTGETPPSISVVFTYKTVVNKVDQDGYALGNAAFKLEKKIKATTAGGEDTWTQIATFGPGANMTTFSFEGLDDGTYKLTETETPDGYNTIDPITFQVVAQHTASGTTLSIKNEDGTDFNGTITFTKIDNEAGYSTDVENRSGSTLPSTGGMGTTILYVGGSILVLLAVVLLVTKKRMGAND